jgi:hypothetical protein
MSYATPVETHKAAKRHRCDWCWQFIEQGETYNRYRFYSDDVGTVRMHPECYIAMQEEAQQAEGGWFEWTPGQDRPVKETP